MTSTQQQWQELVKTKMQSNPSLSLQQAAAEVAKENPQMVEMLLEELIEPATETETESEPDPQAKWQGLVNAATAAGVSVSKTILAIDRHRPGLRQRMLAQANGRSSKATASPPLGTSYESQWRQAVASCRAQGMDARRAALEADKRHPQLRLQMLAEVNAKTKHC